MTNRTNLKSIKMKAFSPRIPQFHADINVKFGYLTLCGWLIVNINQSQQCVCRSKDFGNSVLLHELKYLENIFCILWKIYSIYMKKLIFSTFYALNLFKKQHANMKKL